jgi:hypothetical protein
MLHALSQKQQEADDREYAEGQVDPKDPRPGEAIDDNASGERPNDCRDRPDDSNHALRPAALLKPVEITDNCHRHGVDGTRSESLQRTEDNQGVHRPSKAAQQRASQEQNDADDHHRLAPEYIRELSVNRGRSRLRQQKGREYPAVIVEAPELANNARHGSRNNGRFDCNHKGRQHDRTEDQRPPRKGGCGGSGHIIPLEVHVADAVKDHAQVYRFLRAKNILEPVLSCELAHRWRARTAVIAEDRSFGLF